MLSFKRALVVSKKLCYDRGAHPSSLPYESNLACMKVILLRDVAKIGRKGTVLEVPDGYAQNQLIPKKFAEAATPVNLKKISAVQLSSANSSKQEEDLFAAAVSALQETPLELTAGQVNAQGHLFKAIHESDIVAAAKARGLTLQPAQIKIPAHIKSLGEHTIELKRGASMKECIVIITKAT